MHTALPFNSIGILASQQAPISLILSAALLSLLLLLPTLAIAADPPIYSHKKKGVVKGADVVAYFSLKKGDGAVYGSNAFTHSWNGATWKFSTAENLRKFKANPEIYAPQFGGYCAFAVSHNFTKPIDPDAWEIVDGKLYLNLSRGVQRKWNKDRDTAIARGHANWPGALKACEIHDNCYSSSPKI